MKECLYLAVHRMNIHVWQPFTFRIRFLLFLIFLCVHPVLFAQFDPDRLSVRNFNLENGLSQCVVTDMVTDSRGFIWAGTFDGLNRFDGQNIRVFKHVPNDSNSLPSSKIIRLHADDAYHLWINTSRGLCIFDTRTTQVLHPDFLKTYHPGICGTAQQGLVWNYIPGTGLLQVRSSDFSTRLIRFPSGLKDRGSAVLDLLVREGQVFLIYENGDVLQYNSGHHSFHYYNNTFSNAAIYDNAGFDKAGHLLLGSQHNDMLEFDPQTASFLVPAFNARNIHLLSVRNIRYDHRLNALMLGTYGQGLFVYDYTRDTLYQYLKNDAMLGLTSNYIQCTVHDRNGVMYIGYDGGGFDVLDPYIRKFYAIKKTDPDDLKSLRFVRKILEDDRGNLLIGTSGSGLIRYNRKQRSFEFFNEKNGLNNSDNFIIEMIRLKDELWVGYNGGGIDVLDINSLKPRYSFLPGKGTGNISDGVIWSFAQDRFGKVWVGTRTNGLNKIDPVTKQVKQFTRSQFDFLRGGMRCMTVLKNGNLLIGSEEGLYEIDVQTDQIRPVLKKGRDNQSILSFKTIYIDQKNRVWLGTDGAGIEVYDKDYQFLNTFNSGNALNNDVVYGILPQNDSTLWISTNAGLSCIYWNDASLLPDGKVRIFSYDEKSGLQSNEFNTGAYCKLKDGNLAFGGLNGINVFNPNEIQNSPVVPDVYIDVFKVFENEWRKDTLISYLRTIYLKPFENSFSITFSAIGFPVADKIQYQYRLIGYDKEWIQAGKRNYVSYTNLPSGDYEFQVRACNYDGIWNSNFTSLGIHIAIPFYRTAWFITLLIASILGFLYLWYTYRKKELHEKAELKIRHMQEMAEVEMKALRAQINPHFLFNSLNSINSYILKNDFKMASRYLVKFSQLVRNILNNSSTPYISLKEELNTIELYMGIEGMRFNNQFSYYIEVDPTLNPGNILIPSLLLQPYVENAIWHGLLHKDGEKLISIKVKPESMESISILIDDNGVGREMAARLEQKPRDQKSFGLELGASRLKLIHGYSTISSVEVIDKVDDRRQPSGTTIRIIIPSNIFIRDKISLN